MDHKHLTPEEIDFLIDTSAGYAAGGGTTADPTNGCDECRARLRDARAIVALLESIPRLAPSHKFSDHVMSQVPVFVPWWVSVRDTVKPWVPASQPARIGLGVLATAAASVISVVFLWVLTQTDVLALASGAAGNRVQELFAQGLQALASALFGDSALALIQSSGPLGTAVAVTSVIAVGAVAVLALRRLATASSRRRTAIVSSRA